MSIPLVASNDCHYLQKEDVRAHDVLLCIQTGKTVHESNRFKFSTDQLYFKAPGEMTAYFRDYPGAAENTVNIARRCAYEFDFSYHFPQFSVAADLTTEEIFEQTVRQGFEARLAKIREKDPQRDLDVYTERLDYEISVIAEMGFTGYFLIVADFIRFAKENGVPVGPGRGSAAPISTSTSSFASGTKAGGSVRGVGASSRFAVRTTIAASKTSPGRSALREYAASSSMSASAAAPGTFAS